MKSSPVSLCLLLAWSPVTAQSVLELSDAKKAYAHENAFLIRQDPAKEFSAADLDHAAFLDGFRPANDRDFSLGLSTAAIWYKFSLRNVTGDKWLLRAGNPTAQEVTLYIPRAAGGCDSVAANFTQKIGERPWPSNRYLFSLPFPEGREQVFFLRITSHHSLEIPPQISTVDTYLLGNHAGDVWAGAYLGFILVMVLFNFFVFVSLRDVSYLYYILYVLCIGLVVSTHDGYPFELLWPNAPGLNAYIDVPTSLAGIFAILFTMNFLHTRRIAPGLHRGLYVLIAIYSAAGLLSLAKYTFAAGVVELYVGVLSSLYVFFTAVHLYRKGYKPAKFYLLAWGSLIACIIVFVLTSTGLLSADVLRADPLLLGSAAESLLLSFALADRFHTYRKEKEELMQQQNELLERKVAERTLELKKEKLATESLLLNILPAEIAAELKETGKSEAREYEEVTVMFTDFKDFTTISEQLSPAELVAEIDYFFSAFDGIMQMYGIEKIKTMGDAYMCVGGLPTENTTHAGDIVKAGLAIRDFMARDKRDRRSTGKIPFDIRIGIHTGPVVAGIVGVKKFAYDIWGDTVNLAARMESSGIAGEVNISGTTYALVKEEFFCTYRGKVETKHKGKTDMYFVHEWSGTVLDAPDADRLPFRPEQPGEPAQTRQAGICAGEPLPEVGPNYRKDAAPVHDREDVEQACDLSRGQPAQGESAGTGRPDYALRARTGVPGSGKTMAGWPVVREDRTRRAKVRKGGKILPAAAWKRQLVFPVKKIDHCSAGRH